MKHLLICITALLCGFPASAQRNISVTSPDGTIRMEVHVDRSDFPSYDVFHGKTQLIDRGRLGFRFADGEFGPKLHCGKIERRNGWERYDLITGKSSHVEEPYREVTIPLYGTPDNRRVDLIIRAFNDGVAFRYLFPRQEGWSSYEMLDELTTFDPAGDPKMLTMYLASYTTSHEGFYTQTSYQRLDEGRLMEMPTLFTYPDGTFMAVTEAAIRDYAGLYLCKEGDALRGKLSPLPGQERIKVRASLPHRSPWRVLMISSDVGKLISSNLLTNLNDPCAIADTSWIRPGKTTFSWWNGCVTPDTTFLAGNNFPTNKYYIDFAARSGLDFHSIYGYAEQPWYYDPDMNFERPSPEADVLKPLRTLDMRQISDYAAAQGVGIHLWVNWKPLYANLDKALDQFEEWGVKGMMVDFMDRDDQQMIRIQEEILAKSAQHKIFVQFHGSSKPSGLNRTYPNEFTREGTRNYECYKWSLDMGADLDIAIPFTRLLAGATDYHLGGFRAVPREQLRIRYSNPWVTSTRCHMLGMYVVLESYLGMVCDCPAAYEGQPGFEFIRKVPTTWDETVVPAASVMEYVCVARRKGDDWWIGAINNSQARTIGFPADFLDDREYTAEIYTDASDTDTHPNHLQKKQVILRKGDPIQLQLANDGGAAIHLYPTPKQNTTK